MSIFRFKPVYQERIWGGARLAELYKRTLPTGKKIGESWELADRPDAATALTAPFEGCHTLHDLWKNHKRRVFGSLAPDTARFPILIKVLDTAEPLSVQVHPTPTSATRFKGEPKTELWYFLHCEKEAAVYAGFQKGVTRDMFKKALANGGMEYLLHKLVPQPGDALFVPSGRIHSIGAGNVILEIQQNSDTTYRAYDWHRKDQTGQPRELHIEQALACINFNDNTPHFTQPHGERVLNCPHFSVYRAFIFPGEYRSWSANGSTFSYHFLAQGALKIGELEFSAGDGWLVSADHSLYEPEPGPEGAEVVTVQFPKP